MCRVFCQDVAIPMLRQEPPSELLKIAIPTGLAGLQRDGLAWNAAHVFKKL